MANAQFMHNLPFANVAENAFKDNNTSEYNNVNLIPSTNNDMLADIDPDINNIFLNDLKNQCKNYDTSIEFNTDIVKHNNISLLHTNV